MAPTGEVLTLAVAEMLATSFLIDAEKSTTGVLVKDNAAAARNYDVWEDDWSKR